MFGIVVHGGAGGTSSEAEEECRQVAEAGMEILRQEGSALAAVVEAVRRMEDSGVFNAGLGSVLRFDGVTIEMDALVADSKGLQGAIGAVSGVQNPVLLALEVANSSHLMLGGEGATAFAREKNLQPHPGPSEQARQRFQDLKEEVRSSLMAGEIPVGWTQEELQRLIGSDGVHSALSKVQHDTVGAIAFDKNGTFALAASTGGSGLMRSGRVGDVPHRGAGYEIGERGGVLATGIGEEIIRLRGSDRVYTLLGQQFSPQIACTAVLPFFGDTTVGFIAMTKEGIGSATNSEMAFHSITED